MLPADGDARFLATLLPGVINADAPSVYAASLSSRASLYFTS